MAVSYYGLGSGTRLRDIVFAGSHDASITSGGKATKTQNLAIGKQARAGVRLFDLRIIACSVAGEMENGTKKAELVGYHGKYKSHTKQRHMVGVDGTRSIERSKMTLGHTGLGLKGMLEEARKFVENSTEFLILKFDKCTNWGLIAETCVKHLGEQIYQRGDDAPDEINKATLRQLKGKVVVVFGEEGAKAAAAKGYGPDQGIYLFRNLKETKAAYDPKTPGLQYFGKGGTSMWVKGGFRRGYTKSGKMDENVKKQQELMEKMAGRNAKENFSSDVLGMMYWTATGAAGQSVESRDNVLWSKRGQQKMGQLWLSGLRSAIDTRCEAQRVKATHSSSGSRLKSFIPNIVMMDFADEDRCKVVFDLNRMAATELTQAYQHEKSAG